jgi:hypothetical protein
MALNRQTTEMIQSTVAVIRQVTGEREVNG